MNKKAILEGAVVRRGRRRFNNGPNQRYFRN